MFSFPAGGILFFVVTVVFVFILSWQALWKLLRKPCEALKGCCCGCCSSCGDNNNSDGRLFQGPDGMFLSDEDADRLVALALQRQLNEEASERNRMAKRKERRMWYEYYLRPWTMVRTKKRLSLDCVSIVRWRSLLLPVCCATRNPFCVRRQSLTSFFALSPQHKKTQKHKTDRDTIRSDPQTQRRR